MKLKKYHKHIIYLDRYDNPIPEGREKRYKVKRLGVLYEGGWYFPTGQKVTKRNEAHLKRRLNRSIQKIREYYAEPPPQKLTAVAVSLRTGKSVNRPSKKHKYKIGYYDSRSGKIFVPAQTPAKVSRGKLSRLTTSLKSARGSEYLAYKNKRGQISNFDPRYKYKSEIWHGGKLKKTLTKSAFKLDIVEQIKQESLLNRVKANKFYELKTTGETYAEALNSFFLDLPPLNELDAYEVSCTVKINTREGKVIIDAGTFQASSYDIKKILAERLVLATRAKGLTFTSPLKIKKMLTKELKSAEVVKNKAGTGVYKIRNPYTKAEIERIISPLKKLEHVSDKNILIVIRVLAY